MANASTKDPRHKQDKPPFPAQKQAFVILASDEASYVNGEVLGVTGGTPLP